MVIRPEDRVATIIKADESLIEVLAALSPAFERLRNPAMRKVMARLVTVEQAARMAGLDASHLVEQLNAHVKGSAATADGERDAVAHVASATRENIGRQEADISDVASGAEAADASDEHADAGSIAAHPADRLTDPADNAMRSSSEPEALAAIPADRRVVLDVREDLRSGNEPFRAIMAALRERPAHGALAVRAIFEPVPLYAVMRRQGLAHYTEELGPEDWRVWFYPDELPLSCDRPDTGANASAQPSAPGDSATVAASARDTEDDVVILDVRDLEPPEPMMRTLAALEQLPPGGTLVQLNVRVPQFLLPLLDERGFTYEIREQDAELVRVFIRRRTA
ncbi:MAG: DUF2249 domain-containing protein [Longimicrobiales bacterium]